MPTGLLIISHGSPSRPWTETIARVHESVVKEVSKLNSNVFSWTGLGALEFTHPSILESCLEAESKGVSRIVAMPLFMSRSSHSALDIPTALGMMHCVEPNEQSMNAYMGPVPITLCPTLDSVPELYTSVASCALRACVGLKVPRVLLLAHGGGCTHSWNRMYAKVIGMLPGLDVRPLEIQTLRSVESKNLLTACINDGDRDRPVVLVSCFIGLSGKDFLGRLGYSGERQVLGCDGWHNDPALLEGIARLCVAAGERIQAYKSEQSLKLDSFSNTRVVGALVAS